MRNYVIKLSHLSWCSAVCEIPKVLVPIRNRRLEDHIQLTAFKGGLIPEFISNFVKFSKKEKKNHYPQLFTLSWEVWIHLFFLRMGTNWKKRVKSYVINLPSLRGPAFQFSVWKLSSSCHSAMMRFFSYFSTDDFIRHQPFFFESWQNRITFNLGSKVQSGNL